MASRPKKILVPVDASEHSERAVQFALTRVCRAEIDRLQLLHVQDVSHFNFPAAGAHADMVVPPVLVDELARRAASEAAELVRKFLERARAAKVHAEGFFAQGDAREVIVARAASIRADLIIMGTRGMGALSRTMLGSVSDYVMNHATCPVLIARPPPPGETPHQHPPQRVLLLAVDASDGSKHALRWVLEEFCRPDDVLILLTVLPAPPWAAYTKFYNQDMIERLERVELQEADAMLQEYAEQVQANHMACRKEVIKGDVRETICSSAEQFDADLLLLGCRGLSTLNRLLVGSVSDYCAHHAGVPVLIVKPETHQSVDLRSPLVNPVDLPSLSS